VGRIAATEMLPSKNRCLIYHATGRRGRREERIDEEAHERDESSGVDEFATSVLPFSFARGKLSDLDEFVAVTGYHRKHAIRLLRLGRRGLTSVVRARPRRYGNATAEALVVLWEASDRVCREQLRSSSRLCWTR